MAAEKQRRRKRPWHHRRTLLENDAFLGFLGWFYGRFSDGKSRKRLRKNLEKIKIHNGIANSVQRSVQSLLEKHGLTFHDFFPEVIISYSTGRRLDIDADSAGPGLLYATGLILYLFDNGIECFSDLMTPPGRNWREYMLRLKQSKVMVAMVSDPFLKSVHCLREMADAVAHNVEIIPVRLDEKSARGLDIARDVANMWPDEELEKYSKRKPNAPRVKRELELQRFDVINKLTRSSSFPVRGTILSDEGALNNLIRVVSGELVLQQQHSLQQATSYYRGSESTGTRLEAAKGEDSVIDVFFAMQAPSSVIDAIYEQSHQVSSLCQIGTQIQVCTSNSMEEVRRNLHSIYLTDGRIHDAKVAFRRAETIRMFVWCAEGINELTDESKGLSIEFFGNLFKKSQVPKVAVVCMTYGAQLAGEKLHALGVSNVISIATDPLGRNRCSLGTALIKFCAGILAGDDADEDPLEKLQRDLGSLDPCYKYFQIPEKTDLPRVNQDIRSVQEPMMPNIVVKARKCGTADWFQRSELKALRLNVADLPLLDAVTEYVIAHDEDERSRYVHLKPCAHGRERKETWDRTRALALHVCSEIAQHHDMLFEGGVHRLSSIWEADNLQSVSTEEKMLVWLDLTNESIQHRSISQWIGYCREFANTVMLVTSDAQCFHPAERLVQSMEIIGFSRDMDEPCQLSLSEVFCLSDHLRSQAEVQLRLAAACSVV